MLGPNSPERQKAYEAYITSLSVQDLKNFAEMCTGVDFDCYPIEIVEGTVRDLLAKPNWNTALAVQEALND